MRFFGGHRMRARFGDPCRFLVQADRIEPHGAGHRLAVRETAVRCHQLVAMLGRHFDEITEHLVVLDLERRRTGLIAVPGFERGDGLAGVAAGFAQAVERMIVIRSDKTALAAFGRRRGDQRARQMVDQRRMAPQCLAHVRQQCGKVRAGAKHVAHPPCFGKAVADLTQIARAAAPGDQPSECAADIGGLAQDAAHVRAE